MREAAFFADVNMTREIATDVWRDLRVYVWRYHSRDGYRVRMMHAFE